MFSRTGNGFGMVTEDVKGGVLWDRKKQLVSESLRILQIYYLLQ